MSSVISVENLSKKYIIGHQRQGHTNLREVLAEGARRFTHKLTHPFAAPQDDPTHEEFWALKDVSFDIQQGDRVGIIGRNGAGKSTLLKILSRITEPTSGKVSIKGRVASLLEVGTGFHPELTGRENIFLNGAILGMSKTDIKRKFDEIVAFAEVDKFLDTPVKRYSSGMYVRLAFAVAAYLEPEILIVDEVLAVGDAQFQKKCLGKMKEVGKEGRTVVFVTHNMDLVSSLCNKGILLHSGNVKGNGDIVDIVEQYEVLTSSVLDQSELTPGVLYVDNIAINGDRPKITKVFIHTDGTERDINVKSFEDFVLGFEVYSPVKTANASVAIFIETLSGVTILRIASNPDCGYQVNFQQGINTIYCAIKKLPLPGGDYVLAAGLAIPMREWLMPKTDLCLIKVESNDIYGSGFHMRNNLCLAVADVKWAS